MLELRKIKRNNGIISAEYIPEASEEIGRVSIDITSGEVIKSELTSFDKPFAVYMRQAAIKLSKIAGQVETPETAWVMWY